MDEIVKDFLIESGENLDQLDQDLVKLEGATFSKDLLDSIFRTIHTIKGTCGFLGFPRLEKLTHAGENLLVGLRDGELTLDAEVTSRLLAMVDAIRSILTQIETSGNDGDDDYSSLIAQLTHLQSKPSGSKSVATGLTQDQDPKHETDRSNLSPPASGNASQDAQQEAPDPSKIGGLLIARGQIRAEDLARALELQELGRLKLGEILVAQGAARPEDVLAAQKAVQARNPDSAIETIRVGVNLLDRLMNLVGELVLARNQLLEFSGNTQEAAFQSISQRMNLIATELQEEVMKTRMQPVGNVWNKLPRTVRDLALSCGKEVRLELEGQSTELDRTIIEAIKDPLMHLVRNAIDHGIELPEVRKQAQKDATGVLKVRAFHEGGQVNIEISDDGAGVNPERIRKKAVERGLVAPHHAARMSDHEATNMIFLPGFSTAETVTNVSGRGVGMDVVKTNVEKIDGVIDLQSGAGKGTTVKIKIPLTLAIIPALMVTSAGERFAIPRVNLVELVRLETDESTVGIEMVHGAPVYRLRNRLLPLVYLNHELQLPAEDPANAKAESAVNIVFVHADGQEFGLVVDEITDTQEIVVKPLGKQLKGITAYSGATIMGDGRVALILDILGLAQQARVIGNARDSVVSSNIEKKAGREKSATERQPLLLVQCGDQRRVGIPLAQVARLEEFPVAAIELAGPQEVMQYRGQIMPLIRMPRMSSGIPVHSADSHDRVQVVVYSESGRSAGLVVDRILDIIDENLFMQDSAQWPGILASSIVQQRVTELLDVPQVVRDAVPGFYEFNTPA